MHLAFVLHGKHLALSVTLIRTWVCNGENMSICSQLHVWSEAVPSESTESEDIQMEPSDDREHLTERFHWDSFCDCVR